MLRRISFAILIWAFATGFFHFFGHRILVSPSQFLFLPLFLVLEIITAAAIFGVTKLYMHVDSSPTAARDFGIMGTAIGLIFDTIALWNGSFFLPELTQDQLLAFVIWMCFAYALFLLIPFWIANRTEEGN